jgi:hypothetical protein
LSLLSWPVSSPIDRVERAGRAVLVGTAAAILVGLLVAAIVALTVATLIFGR